MSLTPLFRFWNRESSPLALRSKQFMAAVLRDDLLLSLKKRYYVRLLRDDSDELMEADAKALPQVLRSGDFAIDIGASVGFYTRRLSRLVGPTGLVWSFEPLPPTFEILVAAVQHLALTNVRLFPHAVSDREEVATMEIPRYRGGGESWWDARIMQPSLLEHNPRRSLRQFAVTTRTLDSLLVGSDRPLAFIKIDAEYHELHCLRGAVESLRRWHPIIQLETLEGVDTIVDLLCTLGYSPYRFDGHDFHCPQRGEHQQNLFFLGDHHRRSLERSRV